MHEFFINVNFFPQCLLIIRFEFLLLLDETFFFLVSIYIILQILRYLRN